MYGIEWIYDKNTPIDVKYEEYLTGEKKYTINNNNEFDHFKYKDLRNNFFSSNQVKLKEFISYSEKVFNDPILEIQRIQKKKVGENSEKNLKMKKIRIKKKNLKDKYRKIKN